MDCCSFPLFAPPFRVQTTKFPPCLLLHSHALQLVVCDFLFNHDLPLNRRNDPDAPFEGNAK